jgi:hypothetical protein
MIIYQGLKEMKWLYEPKRWEIINRTPRIDYRNLFIFKVPIKM